jgi:hypothetical protein
METTIKSLLVVLAAMMSVASVQTVRADEITVTGEIVEANRNLSTIVIAPEGGGDSITIVGFPFHNLEIQLDDEQDPLDPDADGITIEAGDCVTVEYSEKKLPSGDDVNKWESLTMYCEECSYCEGGVCTDPYFCFAGDMGLEPRQNRVCLLDMTLAYETTTGTLDMDFEIGTPGPAAWVVGGYLWGSFIPFWTIPLPEVEPPVTIPTISIPIPQIGPLLFVTAVVGHGFDTCWDLEIVDTGS